MVISRRHPQVACRDRHLGDRSHQKQQRSDDMGGKCSVGVLASGVKKWNLPPESFSTEKGSMKVCQQELFQTVFKMLPKSVPPSRSWRTLFRVLSSVRVV